MRCAAGYVLENPCIPRYSLGRAVKIQGCGKPAGKAGRRDRRPESSETIRRPSSSDQEEDEMVRHPRRRGESGVVHRFVSKGHNGISEIPCRVSSDLHEWRNDLGAVSTRDSAKLHYE
jgi:hypothetical protein